MDTLKEKLPIIGFLIILFLLLTVVLFFCNSFNSKSSVRVVDSHKVYFGDSCKREGTVLHLWNEGHETVFSGNWTLEIK